MNAKMAIIHPMVIVTMAEKEANMLLAILVPIAKTAALVLSLRLRLHRLRLHPLQPFRRRHCFRHHHPPIVAEGSIAENVIALT